MAIIKIIKNCGETMRVLDGDYVLDGDDYTDNNDPYNDISDTSSIDDNNIINDNDQYNDENSYFNTDNNYDNSNSNSILNNYAETTRKVLDGSFVVYSSPQISDLNNNYWFRFYNDLGNGSYSKVLNISGDLQKYESANYSTSSGEDGNPIYLYYSKLDNKYYCFDVNTLGVSYIQLTVSYNNYFYVNGSEGAYYEYYSSYGMAYKYFVSNFREATAEEIQTIQYMIDDIKANGG